MRAARFHATILEGHKGAAVEVPFDPAERWGSPAQPIRKGRRGHVVRGTLDGVPIESAIVSRARRFFLLVDETALGAARVTVGDRVSVSVAPRSVAVASANPPRRKRSFSHALDRVRALVTALPETSEKIAWGAPTFRVCDKIFAMFLDDHHGDGRLALWCKAPPGAQEALVRAQPEQFFVPPYVGKGGWLGIHLDRGLDWNAIAALLEEGWRMAAPRRLLTGKPKRPSR